MPTRTTGPTVTTRPLPAPSSTPRPSAPKPNVKQFDRDRDGFDVAQAQPVNITPTPPAAASRSTHVDVSTLSAADRAAVASLYRDYARGMVPMHEQWHQTNGPGGTQGPGSGERFMQFHQRLMTGFNDHLRQQNPELYNRLGGRQLTWDTTTALPKEFEFEGMTESVRGNPRGIDWAVPGYLTTAGGGESFTLNDSATPREIRSLGDIRTPDELGRVLGMSGAHAAGHQRLGGPMAGFASVAESPFLLWHGKLEEIRQQWLTTPNGQEWLKANPSGWTDPNANSHDHGGHRH
jgi:hypothetical protein